MANENLGPVIDGKYLVEELIAQTRLGPLYRGRNIAVERPVAIKVLDTASADNDEALLQFERASRLEARLSHPNVLALTDVGSDGRGRYAIYEPPPATTLRELISREGEPFATDRAVSIIRGVVEGVAAAHSKGVVHGAISPSAVLVDDADGGAVKVFDFGSSTTEEVRYTAPELLRGGEPDTRSDVYSLGVTAYEVLAGRPPFDAADADEIARLQDAPPAPLSSFRQDLPVGLEASILKALAIDPEMRFASAEEFAAELTSIGGDAARANAAALGRDLWKTAFIVIVGIGLLSAVLIYATYTRRTEPATVLQPDANGQPVQPLSPATGTQEESLANLPPNAAELMMNSNMSMPPGTMPGGDGYNPWANGGTPPAGAPPQTYVPPGGQVITIDPNNPSQFMPTEGGVILVPVPANANTAKPTPSPKNSPAANANAAVPPANTAAPKSTPTPRAGGTPPATPKPPAANKPEDLD
ncbi:MAG: serine/threonine protein kinase [Pyrinomonadaceae bacterium]